MYLESRIEYGIKNTKFYIHNSIQDTKYQIQYSTKNGRKNLYNLQETFGNEHNSC